MCQKGEINGQCLKMQLYFVTVSIIYRTVLQYILQYKFNEIGFVVKSLQYIRT